MKVLVLGATGYIGHHLVPCLLERNHEVVCLVRDKRKVYGKCWNRGVVLYEGDVLRPETLAPAFQSVDVVYYLVHSMVAGEREFADRDRRAAMHVGEAAKRANVRRIIYLGGLGRRGTSISDHLRSRHEVGDILRCGSALVTEFRAAVIVGAGSASFEMMHHLVNRLPVMICPQWVRTKTQPIGIADVLRYLACSIDSDDSAGRTVDIGGPEVMTYKQMMAAVAQVLGLKRVIIEVPVLTPKLSSYWVNLVTPMPTILARALIESLRHETVCENGLASELFPFAPLSFAECTREALQTVRASQVGSNWASASTGFEAPPAVDPSHLLSNTQTVATQAPPQYLFHEVGTIGGQNGWYYANWLWKIRGFIDKQLGGVGLRRGRRHPVELISGEALDFWRVEEYEPGRRMLLRAEMKVWGRAWLEFQVGEHPDGNATLTQTARYYPRGLIGLLYWFGTYPLHVLIFRGLARAISKRAEQRYSETCD